jgi:hypothetical protein
MHATRRSTKPVAQYPTATSLWVVGYGRWVRTEECRSRAKDYQVHSENDIGAVFIVSIIHPIIEATFSRIELQPSSHFQSASVLYKQYIEEEFIFRCAWRTRVGARGLGSMVATG